MARKSNIYQILFLLFLLVAFVLGGYVYSTMDLKQMISKMEGLEGGQDPNTTPSAIPNDCHDLLIQRGASLLLYNTKLPMKQGENPIVFSSLEEYGNYFKSSKSAGKNCPVLFLQSENNAQGNDVYRIRPSPHNPFAGIPANSPLVQPYDGKPVPELDASRDNGYNKNMYPGFDPDNLHIGRITELDIIHESTENAPMSDNPMDSNWGGILYTQGQVDSGKYVENEVTRTNYVTPKGGQNLPIYGPSNPYP
jgi:hypothetical protein